MSFDQNMIIDATTGSIARFVNHSCSPNCRMIKWIVSGQPRMALFAGDKPIMTGDELTYDYNFDPFSAKNVQKCLCGSANCRGVLGPRSKPPPKKVAEAASAGGKAKRGAKRKLKELLEGRGMTAPAAKPVAKKPRITSVKAVKRSLSQVSLKKAAKGAAKGAAARGRAAAKGAVTVIRKSVSSISVSAKSSSATQTKPGRASKTYRKTTTTSALRLYGKSGAQKKPATATKQASAVSIAAAARAKAKARAAAAAATTSPSATIVAASTEASPSKAKAKGAAKGAAAKRSPVSASKATRVKKVTKIRARSRIGITKPPVESPRTGVEISRSASKVRLVQEA